MPVLLYEHDMKKDQYVNLSKKRRIWEQPLDLKMAADFLKKEGLQNKYEKEPEGMLQNTNGEETKDSMLYRPKDWKYLYKNSYDRILHPTAINNHYDNFKLYVEWGSEVNIRDFQGWTPLHCAAHSGNIDIVKFLCENPAAELETEDDEKRTPLLVAIESGNVLDNENAASVLLQAGAELDKDIWDKLLVLSADHDLIVYPRIAHKREILSLKFRDEDRFSIHKIVKCEAINIIKFIVQNVDPKIIKKA